jgi:hypothetical protein
MGILLGRRLLSDSLSNASTSDRFAKVWKVALRAWCPGSDLNRHVIADTGF